MKKTNVIKGNMTTSIISSKNERQKFFDVAKGVGILLVIVGHMYDDYFDYSWFHILHNIIYSFHMPLFFFVSGFFLYKRNGIYGGKIRGRAKALFLPYFFVGGIKILIITLHNWMHEMDFMFAIDMIKMQNWNKFEQTALAAFWGVLYGLGETRYNPFYINNVGALWYLPALFFASWIVLQLIDKKYVTVYICLIALGGWITSIMFAFRMPFSLQAGMVAALYVYIGYLANKKQLFKNKSKKANIFRGGGNHSLDNFIICAGTNRDVQGILSIRSYKFYCWYRRNICAFYYM